jgi:transcriptional regulator with XRE-family HTH domain
MPDSFGARLREQRERQHVALTTIAEQTKIKVSLLEALERDDVSHWPSGIFRRAFIRAYAHAIGLEPDVVLREFLELYPEPVEVVDPLSVVGGADSTDGAPTRLRYLVASAIGSVSRLRARPAQRSAFVFDGPIATDHVSVSPEPIPDGTPATVTDEPCFASDAAVVPVNQNQEQPVAPVDIAPEPVTPPEPVLVANVPSASLDSPEPDLLAVAHLCTELGRVQTMSDVPPLLHEMARLLDAIGLIVWLWDPIASELRPALAHGYSDRVVAQLPRVERDTNNATAAAFRATQTCVVNGDDVDNGALAVPLMGPGVCVGVLAIELAERREEKESVRAQAMIFAAQLATLIGTAQPMEASDRRLA